MTFELPNLPYDYDALSPYMSRETLEYHHDKHHQTYVTNTNTLLKGAGFENKKLEDIIKESFTTHPGLFNNVAQHYNHTFFWKGMQKGGGGIKIPQKLSRAIDSDLGGYAQFRRDFLQSAVGQFGSGWTWLILRDGQLEIMKTSNSENPLIYGVKPLLTVDVWEHSYYIDYRNARQKYLEAFIDNLINWDYVLEMYESI
ncbi:MAG: Fe-Mn family [Candidatus Tokpelaia sp. JSC161]|jgi:Fe-Mn family superoxide dismutase|nr:MAG: Fe-Mn family [Candidatus Tokpelaia sp. JSC161]